MWAIDNAPHGDLEGVSNTSIARAAMWPRKNHGTFVDALRLAGFIDEANGLLHIHDYDDYIGKLISRREQNKERMSRARAEHVASTNMARAPATVPNRTQPYRSSFRPSRLEGGSGGSAELPAEVAGRLARPPLAVDPSTKERTNGSDLR
jgi:hypothetical protein